MLEGLKLKSSFIGGYNKKEVLKIIEQLTQKASEDEERYKEEIDSMKDQNNVLSDEINHHKKQVLKFEQETKEKNEKIAQLLESLKSVRLECENQRKQIEMQKEHMEKILHAHNEEEFNYHRLSKGIGDMMINVKSTCDEIILKSKEEANVIIKEANHNIYQIGNEVRQYKQQFGDSKVQISECLKTIQENIDHIYRQFDETESSLLNRKTIKIKSEDFEKCEGETEHRVSNLMEVIKTV